VAEDGRQNGNRIADTRMTQAAPQALVVAD
jgi:hypothetical protein